MKMPELNNLSLLDFHVTFKMEKNDHFNAPQQTAILMKCLNGMHHLNDQNGRTWNKVFVYSKICQLLDKLFGYPEPNDL